MKAAAVVLWAQYCAFENDPLRLHAELAVMGIVILTAGLYSMNDIADVNTDRVSLVKRFRVLATEKLSIVVGKIWAGLCVVSGLLFLFTSRELLGVIGILLVLNAWAYSFPPARLKERPFFDILSGAVFSQLGRYSIGHFSISDASPPMLPLVAAVLFKIGSYLAYRIAGHVYGEDVTRGSHRFIKMRVALIALWVSASTVGYFFYEAKVSLIGWIMLLFMILFCFLIHFLFYRDTGPLTRYVRGAVFGVNRDQ